MKPIDYKVVLEIPGEPRESGFHTTDFEEAVKYCLNYARKYRGIKVRVQVIVPRNSLVEHGYTIFEVCYPSLDDWMVEGIKNHFGQTPPV